jgi:7-carboxy-7-deazaguanine synthase
MRIAEVFTSIQGEGRWIGVPSVFLRVSGCNLRCSFCDTPYTSWAPEGEDWSLDRLVDHVAGESCEHVVITGGEPMLFAELVDLTRRLRALGRVITIETAGTVDLAVTADLMSISPKRANSVPSANSGWRERHEQRRHAPAVMRRLLSDYDYQLKFVIDRPEDVEDVEQYLQALGEVDPGRVFLMPQTTDAADHASRCAWLGPVAESRGWRLSRRLHIELFGHRRGV